MCEKKTLSDLAREYKINYGVLYNRLYRLKWPLEKALTEPIQTKRVIEFNEDDLPKSDNVVTEA